MKSIKSILILTTVALSLLTGNAFAAESVAELKAQIAKLEAQVASHNAERSQTMVHLKTFDELDLVAFNSRDMARIGEIHADNVIVHNADGTQTSPFKPHSEELDLLFDTFDFKVKEHIVGFGFGEWTAGISISEGRWVKPLILKDGTVLKPTNKTVSLKIATIARWENGRIAEEYLFWDNADWNRQVGLK
ncbi:ester cyclase [Shewanella gelidimarina]|uniref:ester cyclase n=1 Tax=Shewanella gelidimarina TaxID=56813 RepID=UPI00200D9F87|nr:ester cyclase [Shewanella gelidimarina]MCL1057501.1 ester cyclase [Shewanella gelidimarina]